MYNIFMLQNQLLTEYILMTKLVFQNNSCNIMR